MSDANVFITEVFRLGPVVITNTVVVTWFIVIGLGVAAWLATRSLSIHPTPIQVVIEGVVEALDSAVREVAPTHAAQVTPLIGTLWLFIAAANLISLVPSVRSPTGDLSLTAGLAIIVLVSVHFYGIRTHGLKHYLKHYLQPSPILLPFHLVSELTRTLALAIRLFGNIFSLQMAAMLILLVAGFLAPIPVLMLHIIEAIVQSYIFGMLALIYVAGAIQSQQPSQTENRNEP